MALNITPYQPTAWVNDSEPDIDDTGLNKIEQGIKSAVDGVNAIVAALTSQIADDPNKFASIAALYAVNQSLNNLSNTVTTLNGNLTAITPILLTTLGAFLGTVTRNASTISGKQVNVSLTITSPATSIANDIAFFYINKKLKPVVAPILIGNYGVGYVYSSINASNDTVFAARMSAGSIPANTEIYINFNCSIDV